MNVTESGSIAVGAPLSLARLHQELNHYCLPEGTLSRLCDTPEGAALLRKYMVFVGGYPVDKDSSDAVVCNFVGYAADIERERMQYMIYGALFALEYSLAGRITKA